MLIFYYHDDCIYCWVKLQLFMKMQATKAEIQDLQEVHVNERQEFEKNLEDLNRDLKLK